MYVFSVPSFLSVLEWSCPATTPPSPPLPHDILKEFISIQNVAHYFLKSCFNCALRSALCLLESGGKCHRPLAAGYHERSSVGGLTFFIVPGKERQLPLTLSKKTVLYPWWIFALFSSSLFYARLWIFLLLLTEAYLSGNLVEIELTDTNCRAPALKLM